MAGVHNALRRTELSAAIKRALGDTRAESGIERYGETLQPIIDLWRQPEFAVLRGEVPWARAITQAAVAAEFSGVAVVNPAGSGLLVMIDAGTATTGSAGNLSVALVTAAGVTATYAIATNNTRDTRARVINNQPPVPQIWSGSDAASLIAAGFQAEFIATPDLVLRKMEVAVPAIIAPGMAYLAQGNAVLVSISVCWAGRVRVLQPGELT